MKAPSARAEQLWPIGRLKRNPRNAREHSDEQVSQLAKSMEEFGITFPILVDETDTILAGHGKLEGARRLGLEEVPVIVISGLTDSQKDTYLIADNAISLNSSWNEDKLRALVEKLERELTSMEITGLSPQELDRLLADLAPEESFEDEDAVPQTSVFCVTAPDDVWILDKHRLGCFDATADRSLQRVLQDQMADLCITDMPYNCNYQQKRKQKAAALKIANDNLGDQFEEFSYAACLQILLVTRGAIYLFMSSSELHTLYKAFVAAGGHWSTFLIWAKDRFTLGRSDYQRMYEPILYGWKEGGPHFWCGARNEGDVWFVPKPKVNRLHPTMKPVSLIERAIRHSSQRGDLVLDPFGGSGSTLIACEKSGRRAAVVELEPKYVDVMVRRWEAYTHREVHLEADGRSFAMVANERSRRAA